MNIATIAKESGLSATAVSQIINKKESASRFSKEARSKVLKVARKWNYHPNYLASSLRSGKRFCIGIAATSLDKMNDPALGRVYSGIGEVLNKHNYFMTFLPLQERTFEDILQRVARNKMVDGLIIVVYTNNYKKFNESTSLMLQQEGMPYVAIHSTRQPFYCHNVGFNADDIAFLGTRHLIGQGYKEIGIICARNHPFDNILYNSYCQTMDEAHLPQHDCRIDTYSHDAKEGYEIGKQVIKKHGIKEAYVINSDQFAYGFIETLREAGKKVPEDVAVVGCDDVYREEDLPLKLTSLTRKLEERGRKAAEILFKEIEIDGDAAGEHKRWIAEPELIVRESSLKNC